MKKKYIFFTLLSITFFSLCSCKFMNNGGANYSYRPIGESSNNADVPVGDLTAEPAKKTYAEYIKNNVYPLSMTPSTKKAKLLVIPVWFTDSNKYIMPSKREQVRDDINTVYFGKNTDVGWRSVKTYYEEESHDANLKLTGEVSEWYEPGVASSNYYTDGTSTNSEPVKTCSLVKTAVDWYFTNHSDKKRTDFDCNKDCYLDGVMLIYGAPDYQALDNSRYDNMWAYCFWIQDKNSDASNPIPNAFFWASYDFMYGGEVANIRTGKANYYSGFTKYTALDSHTYIHEMGHMFGLMDYYDYSGQYKSEEKGYNPAGGFSMQDHNVGGHDPFSSYALGWGKAYVPTATTEIYLKPFVSSGEMIILSPSYNTTMRSAFDEYLVLEYYTGDGLNYLDSNHMYMEGKKSYPTGSKQSGIRLWHVDARLVYSSTNKFSTEKITTDPSTSQGHVTLLMSNSYYTNGIPLSYLTPVYSSNPSYDKFNLLELIRNSRTAKTPAAEEDNFTASDLFKKSDTFSMSKCSKQFVREGKLNKGTDLGFSFTVKDLNTDYATITVTKL